jgi:hypothetical protein
MPYHCGSIHLLPHNPSWHSAELVKHRDNFYFFMPYHCITRRNIRIWKVMAEGLRTGTLRFSTLTVNKAKIGIVDPHDTLESTTNGSQL